MYTFHHSEDIDVYFVEEEEVPVDEIEGSLDTENDTEDESDSSEAIARAKALIFVGDNDELYKTIKNEEMPEPVNEDEDKTDTEEASGDLKVDEYIPEVKDEVTATD